MRPIDLSTLTKRRMTRRQKDEEEAEKEEALLGEEKKRGDEGCEHADEVVWIKWDAGQKCSATEAKEIKGKFKVPWDDTEIGASYTGTCKTDSMEAVNYCSGPGGTGKGPWVPNDLVKNPPVCDGTDTSIIKLQDISSRKIKFDKPIVGLMLLFLSINGNAWTLDFDFDVVLSNAGDGATAGHWGVGTAGKVKKGSKYSIQGTGEPVGIILFRNAISEFSWESSAVENWNGFSLGIRSGLEQWKCKSDDPNLLYDTENMIGPGNKVVKAPVFDVTALEGSASRSDVRFVLVAVLAMAAVAANHV